MMVCICSLYMRQVLDDAEDCQMSMFIYRCHVMMCISRYMSIDACSRHIGMLSTSYNMTYYTRALDTLALDIV